MPSRSRQWPKSVRARFPESQRDSIIQPSVDGPSQAVEERLRWVNVPPIPSTLKGLNQTGVSIDATPMGLFHFGLLPGVVAPLQRRAG